MAEEVGAVQAGVRRAVQETLAKMARTLEKLRRSSLSYLDAAVTSVSSAAVASAQATADQLTRALRDVADALQGRLAKVRWPRVDFVQDELVKVDLLNIRR